MAFLSPGEGPIFFDSSILVAGLIEIGPEGQGAQRLMTAVADRDLAEVTTAWDCCLEFYSVTTRLPPEFRLVPADALRLVEEEVFERFEIHQLPVPDLREVLRAAARERIAGGRIYDAHIAEVARSTGARRVVTGNRRHFVSLLRYGIRVLTAEELVAEAGL